MEEKPLRDELHQAMLNRIMDDVHVRSSDWALESERRLRQMASGEDLTNPSIAKLFDDAYMEVRLMGHLVELALAEDLTAIAERLKRQDEERRTIEGTIVDPSQPANQEGESEKE